MEMENLFNSLLGPTLVLLGLVFIAISYIGIVFVWYPYNILLKMRRQGIPTAPFRPFIGQLPEYHQNLLQAAEGTEPGKRDEKFVDYFRECETKYGPLVATCVGPVTRLMISDPVLLREVLTGNSQDWPKDRQQQRLLTLLGNGLINSNGSLWSRQRRMLNPSFGHRHIKEVMDVMITSSQKTVRQWTEQLNTSNGVAEIDVNQGISALALEIIGQSAFGADISGGSEQAREIYVTVAEILEATIECIVKGYIFIPFYKSLPLKETRIIAKCEKKIRTLTLGLIKKRREAQSKGQIGGDLLASMLAATDDETDAGMSNEQLMDESLNFLLAGHETTAQLVTWTMYLLARHPDWQQRVRTEAQEVLWSQSEEIEWNHLAALKDLHMVLMESLRLFPPIPALLRGLQKDMKLGPYTIPKGTLLYLPVSHLHRIKKIWGEDADQFRPERFADGVAHACKEPHVFIPFSAGPRNCIGQAFAMTEAKIMMAYILRSFLWRLAPGFKHSTQSLITLRPNKGMPMLLERLEELPKAPAKF